MSYIIEDYKPISVFNFFEDISKIPRCSAQERDISNFLVKFAKDRNLEVYSDNIYNVVIKKPASKGYENATILILQGHLDMVCEKEPGSSHDFSKDPIPLYIENGNLKSKGTTLGADNGVAVAMMMTILDDKTLKHPALECVFTTQEEIGLNGAAALDPNILKGRTMINLDSEEVGVATVSCAGGFRMNMNKSFKRKKKKSFALTLDVSNLIGGHSGIEITFERENANKLISRAINEILINDSLSESFYLISFDGGNKDNAITRHSKAVLAFENVEKAKIALDILNEFRTGLIKEIITDEPDFKFEINLSDHEEDLDVIDGKATREIITALHLAPYGVQKRNMRLGGFVITSLNTGVITTGENKINISFSPRSSVPSSQNETRHKLVLIAKSFGFNYEISGDYPSWSYAEVSPIRDIMMESYKSLFNEELKVEAIHAGLECGIFSHKLEGLDVVAIGPSISGAHTPDETLDLKSLEHIWKLVIDTLERVK